MNDPRSINKSTIVVNGPGNNKYCYWSIACLHLQDYFPHNIILSISQQSGGSYFLQKQQTQENEKDKLPSFQTVSSKFRLLVLLWICTYQNVKFLSKLKTLIL